MDIIIFIRDSLPDSILAFLQDMRGETTRLFDQYSEPVFAGLVALVIMLLVLRLMRRRKQRARETQMRRDRIRAMQISAANNAGQPNMIRMPEIDNSPTPKARVMRPVGSEDGSIDRDGEREPESDPVFGDVIPDLDTDDNDPDTGEDIVIPRMGENAPETDTPIEENKKQDASEDEADSVEIIVPPAKTPPPPTPQMTDETARLAQIERDMLALRELYAAGLIASEIYVIKTRELAEKSKRAL